MCTRWIRLLGLGAVLLCGAAPAIADIDADAAKRVVDAHAKGDRDVLRSVAADARIDVWEICERLLESGEPDAADALVALADVAPEHRAKLSRYVEWRKAHPLPNGAWKIVDSVETLRKTRKLADARRHATEAGLPDDGVLGATHLRQRMFLATKPDAALGFGEQSADVARAIGWSRGVRDALMGSMELSFVLKKPKRVVALGPELLELLGSKGSRLDRYHVHGRLAAAFGQLRQRKRAVDHARSAIPLAPTLKQRRDAARHLATLDRKNPEQHTFRDELLALRALEVQLNNAHGVAAADARLSTVDAILGRWAVAVDRIEGALAHLEENGTAGERRGAHLNAAFVALEMLNNDRALHHLARAREAGKQVDLDDTTLYALEAAAYGRRNEHAKALEAYEVLLTRTDRISKAELAGLWINRATVELRMGRFAAAAQSLNAAETRVGPLGPNRVRAHLLVTKSDLALAAGDVERAVAHAEEARSITDRFLLTGPAIQIESRLASGYLARGDYARASLHAGRTLDLVLARSAVLPERLGAQSRAELPGVMAVAIEAPLRMGDMGGAFERSERIRAVALRSRLGGPRAGLDLMDPTLLAEERRLRLREAEDVAACRRAARADSVDAADAAFERLRGTRERLDRHRERMHARHAAAAQLVDPQVDTLEETQKRLGPTEAHVQFMMGIAEIFALVVTRNTARQVRIGTPASLEALLASAVLEDATAPYEDALFGLGARVVVPLKLAPSIDRVTIVPIGRLESLPFPALLSGRRVTLLPSATVGRLLAKQSSRGGTDVLGVGDPRSGAALPGAAREAERVGDVRLLGKDATEAAVKKALLLRKRWRAVHLACHAVIDPDHALRTSLALAPSGDDDGFWRVSEILQSQVPADFVVLSACSSAQAKTFGHEGRVGLVHAFFVAGATHVLASLWDIDDAATEVFMTHLHAKHAAGASPAEALRDSQAFMRSQPRWKHPAHWAGWQLWGPALR